MVQVPGGRAGKAAVAIAAYAAFLQARSRVLTRAEKEGRRIGPKSLGLFSNRLLNIFSELVGVRLASEGGEGLGKLDAARRYLIVWHPHGFIAWSAMFIVSRMAILGHPTGREWFAMVAPALFRIPIIAEALMLSNGRRVDKKVVETYLEKGKAIALQPGGIKEQMITRHDQEQAVFPANLGFIRMAMRYGMDLLPVYLFNENQIYKRVFGLDKVTQSLFKYTGFGLPILTGRFGLPMAGLLPLTTGVHVRWGMPIEVSKNENPADEQVEELFLLYLEGLRRIFHQHVLECLPPAVAARGLTVIRVDGRPVPPDPFQAATEAAAAAAGGPTVARSRL